MTRDSVLGNERQERSRTMAIRYILNYLCGDTPSQTLVNLNTICNDRGLPANKILKEIALYNESGQLDHQVQLILYNIYPELHFLQASPHKKKNPQGLKLQRPMAADYKHLLGNAKNLAELLENIGLFQVEYLLDHIISKSKPERNWASLSAHLTFVTGLTGLIFYSHGFLSDFIYCLLFVKLPEQLRLGLDYLSSVINIPVLGFAFASIGLLTFYYQLFSSGSTNNYQKLTDAIFETVRVGLNLLAYSIIIAANGIMSANVSLLFVLSSFTALCHAFGHYTAESSHHDSLEINLKASGTEYPAAQARLQFSKKLARNNLIVEAVAGFLNLITMSIWCFTPPSLFLTTFCIALSLLTDRTRKLYVEKNTHEIAIEQQDLFRHGIFSRYWTDIPRAPQELAATKSARAVCDSVGLNFGSHSTGSPVKQGLFANASSRIFRDFGMQTEVPQPG